MTFDAVFDGAVKILGPTVSMLTSDDGGLADTQRGSACTMVYRISSEGVPNW